MGGQHSAKVRRWYHDHLTGLGDPRRQEHAQAGEHVQLAEKPASTVLGDQSLVVAAGVEQDVDRAGEDHEEVVALVAFAEQVLAGLDRSPGAESAEGGQLRVAERRKRDVAHGRRLRAAHGIATGERTA